MIGQLAVGGGKANTHAADAVQVARDRCRLAELAPQPGQVHVDGPVTSAVGLTPYVRQQLTFGDHLPGPLSQGQQEVELLARQVNGQLVKADLAGQRVDPETTHDQRSLRDRGAAAAKNRPQPGFDLPDPERLDDVVVGAPIQGFDHVRIVVAGGDDNDRYLADRPKHRQNLQPVNVGKPEVQKHDIGCVLQRGLQPG